MSNIINNWPNADLHNLNLDWILNEIKKLGIKVENTEKFVPHVAEWNNGQWDVNHEYLMNEIVFNGNEIYIAIKNVPVGVNINDTMYWALVGTDSYITNKVDKAGDTMTGVLTLPGMTVANINVPAISFGDSNGIIDSILVNIAGGIKKFTFRQFLDPNDPKYNDYVLPDADGILGTYDIITSKSKIAWQNALTWTAATAAAKMDILLIFDYDMGGMPIRFNINIAVPELVNTKYYFSNTAYTSAGEAYVSVGADYSNINCTLVIAGTPATVNPNAIIYR